MGLTLGQAAKQSGKAKGTISKAIKNGELSATRLNNGNFDIEPSEFGRWLDTVSKKPRANDQNGQLETPKEPSILHREIELLRELSGEKDKTIADLRERLDSEAEERRKLTLMLTDQTKKPPETRPIGLWLAVGAVVLILGAILTVLVLRGPISVATGPGSNPALSGTL